MLASVQVERSGRWPILVAVVPHGAHPVQLVLGSLWKVVSTIYDDAQCFWTEPSPRRGQLWLRPYALHPPRDALASQLCDTAVYSE